MALPSLADDLPYKEYKQPIFLGELFNLRLKEALPPDAAEYVDRYRNCRHWRGEDAYNKERGGQIRNGIEGNCTGLEDREKSIHAKYQNGTRESEVINSIIKEIEAGVSIPSFVLHDPLRKSVILNEYYEAHAQYVIRSVNQQIQKYEAIVEKLRNEKDRAQDGATNDLKMAKYMLEVQKNYLDDVMKNIDRLHPITREQIKRLEPKLSQVLAVEG
jgi:hypothetical protein